MNKIVVTWCLLAGFSTLVGCCKESDLPERVNEALERCQVLAKMLGTTAEFRVLQDEQLKCLLKIGDLSYEFDGKGEVAGAIRAVYLQNRLPTNDAHLKCVEKKLPGMHRHNGKWYTTTERLTASRECDAKFPGRDKHDWAF